MRTKTKIGFPWIALLLMITLTGCGTGNLVRRAIGVEEQPGKIGFDGVVAAVRTLEQTTSQHPPTQVLYISPDGGLGCVQIKGQDLGKVDGKVVPFGMIEGKRRWNQETVFGPDCPEAVSWQGKPKKTAPKTSRIDQEMWRSFLWDQVGKNIRFLAPVEGRVLFDLFWPREIPPQLIEVWESIRSTRPPLPLPAGSILPADTEALPPRTPIADEDINSEINVNG